MAPSAIGLPEMLACVDREIAMRARVYARWVAQTPPKMTAATAAQEQARMHAVRVALLRGEALQRVIDGLEKERGLDLVPVVAAEVEKLASRYAAPRF